MENLTNRPPPQECLMEDLAKRVWGSGSRNQYNCGRWKEIYVFSLVPNPNNNSNWFILILKCLVDSNLVLTLVWCQTGDKYFLNMLTQTMMKENLWCIGNITPEVTVFDYSWAENANQWVSADALELCFSCTNQSKYELGELGHHWFR